MIKCTLYSRNISCYEIDLAPLIPDNMPDSHPPHELHSNEFESLWLEPFGDLLKSSFAFALENKGRIDVAIEQHISLIVQPALKAKTAKINKGQAESFPT